MCHYLFWNVNILEFIAHFTWRQCEFQAFCRSFADCSLLCICFLFFALFRKAKTFKAPKYMTMGNDSGISFGPLPASQAQVLASQCVTMGNSSDISFGNPLSTSALAQHERLVTVDVYLCKFPTADFFLQFCYSQI